MKKISLVSAVVLAAVSLAGISPAQAEAQKSIAIIDASFESHLIPGDVVEVCVVAQSICDSKPKLSKTSQWEAFNHGTIMADIIRSVNPTAKLFLITAGTSRDGIVNAVNLNQALKWINQNNETQNITAISFSYNSGVGSRCRPMASGVNVNTLHSEIVSNIANLKSEGTLVYAASGNYASGNNIDYPACIDDVVAVGSNQWRGSQAKSDIIVTGFKYFSPNLKSGIPSNQNRSQLLNSGTYEYNVSYTTSVTTALTAANN